MDVARTGVCSLLLELGEGVRAASRDFCNEVVQRLPVSVVGLISPGLQRGPSGEQIGRYLVFVEEDSKPKLCIWIHPQHSKIL